MEGSLGLGLLDDYYYSEYYEANNLLLFYLIQFHAP